MKYSLIVFMLLATALTPWQVDAHRVEKPRVIVTTDGEIDDRSSMVRFLMYASDYDVAGIVQVNGVQKDGHSKSRTTRRSCPTCASTTPIIPMPRNC